mmetsp:Transcript_104911/g.281973  ORF Transcript_104911/g.281973 Transcript_104911/m.281973 type:complete len:282 (+) Transcript_104911:387-1232(+)
MAARPKPQHWKVSVKSERMTGGSQVGGGGGGGCGVAGMSLNICGATAFWILRWTSSSGPLQALSLCCNCVISTCCCSTCWVNLPTSFRKPSFSNIKWDCAPCDSIALGCSEAGAAHISATTGPTAAAIGISAPSPGTPATGTVSARCSIGWGCWASCPGGHIRRHSSAEGRRRSGSTTSTPLTSMECLWVARMYQTFPCAASWKRGSPLLQLDCTTSFTWSSDTLSSAQTWSNCANPSARTWMPRRTALWRSNVDNFSLRSSSWWAPPRRLSNLGSCVLSS